MPLIYLIGFFTSLKFGLVEEYNLWVLTILIGIFSYILITFKVDSTSSLHAGLKRIANLSNYSIALVIGWLIEVAFIIGLLYKFLIFFEKS